MTLLSRPAARLHARRLGLRDGGHDSPARGAVGARPAGCRGVRVGFCRLPRRPYADGGNRGAGQGGGRPGPGAHPGGVRTRRRPASRGARAVRRADLHPGVAGQPGHAVAASRPPGAAGCARRKRARGDHGPLPIERRRARARLRVPLLGYRAGRAGRSAGRAAGWRSISPAGSGRFCARDGAGWRIAAGHRGTGTGAASWSVSYAAFSSGFPGSITISQEPADGVPATALTFQVSQLDTNVPIDGRAFDVVVPADAQPLTLEELRQSGPLADRGSRP